MWTGETGQLGSAAGDAPDLIGTRIQRATRPIPDILPTLQLANGVARHTGFRGEVTG